MEAATSAVIGAVVGMASVPTETVSRCITNNTTLAVAAAVVHLATSVPAQQE